MAEYIINTDAIPWIDFDETEVVAFFGEPVHELVRCKDCRLGREVCGNIECCCDLNVPPEYHGYDWFCPNGERKEE